MGIDHNRLTTARLLTQSISEPSDLRHDAVAHEIDGHSRRTGRMRCAGVRGFGRVQVDHRNLNPLFSGTPRLLGATRVGGLSLIDWQKATRRIIEPCVGYFEGRDDLRRDADLPRFRGERVVGR
jgi:hypothetical protein